MRDMQTDIDASVMAILDRAMTAKERYPPICKVENIHCPVCDFANSTLRTKSGTASVRSNVRCKRCHCLNKSGQWLRPCGTVWPKCHTYRRVNSLQKFATKNNSKARLLRHYGTDKHLPAKRTRPGEKAAENEPPAACYESSVGRNDTQSECRPQFALNLAKRPKAILVVDPDRSDLERNLSGTRHKRQLDTHDYAILDPLPKRARVNLPAGAILAQRFPQHVQRDAVSDIHAASNKRRRRLPFKTEGSHNVS